MVLAALLVVLTSRLVAQPVARWHGYSLNLVDFASAYQRYATAMPGRDTPERRRAFALDQFERRLLAAQARDAGLGERPWVRNAEQRAREHAVRAAYFRAALGDRVPEPTEKDVRAAFEQANTRLLLRQVFTPDADEARRWHAEIMAGAPFDSLARLGAARYGGGAAHPEGLLGWVSWGDLGVAPEAVAYALPLDSVGAPVASENGWHLLRVVAREETGVADASTFEAARDRLAFAWRQRRFDEAAAAFLRDRLAQVSLVVEAATLRRLWPLVAPYAPRGARPAVSLALAREAPGLIPDDLHPETPLARVDGEPFTVADLLSGLPDVPADDWSPDLIGVLETAIRDRLVVRWAREAGVPDAVGESEAAAARQAALYQEALATAADTLDLSRFTAEGYRRLRDTYFAQRRTATLLLWAYPDSSAAAAAMARWQQGAPWEAAARTTDTTTVVVDLGAPGAFAEVPFGALDSGGRRAIAGPLLLEDVWRVVELRARETTYAPLDEVRDQLPPLLESLRMTFAHRALLPPAYRREDVTLFPETIDSALPYYER